MIPKQYTCAVIGDWHLAYVTAACLSHLGHKTLLVNPSSKGPAPIDDKLPPPKVPEPGLLEMIERNCEVGLLQYCDSIEGDWAADYVWLSIDTPISDNDEPDTESLMRALGTLRDLRKVRTLLVVHSQVPVGFSRDIKELFGMSVVCVPENLRLGKGIETFLNADRTVIGASDPEDALKVQTLLQKLKTEFLLCDLPTAEMIKHATNAFLATSISFANEMANIGESFGVDNHAVARALKLDRRIGSQAYLSPGLGFSGGTIPRDLRSLQSAGKKHGKRTALIDSVLEVNESTTKTLYDSLLQYFGNLSGRRILIIGYTYKAGAHTLRRSLSLDLASRLSTAGAEIWGYDPVMNLAAGSVTQFLKHHFYWKEIKETPDAVLAMTARPEFKNLDWSYLSPTTQLSPTPLVFDTQNCLNPRAVLDAGFAYKCLWQPLQQPIFPPDRGNLWTSIPNFEIKP